MPSSWRSCTTEVEREDWDLTWNAALEAGGVRRFAQAIMDEDPEQQFRIRPGLSWGKGFESRWGGGWMGIESSLEWRAPTGEMAFKTDLTAGLKPTDRWMGILQVQYGNYPDSDPVLRLVPSVVRKFGSRTHLQLGIMAPLVGDDTPGIKFATWITF